MIKNSICRRKEITEEKQKRDKNANAAGEEKIGKVERNRRQKGIEGGKESDRIHHRKGMKARKETKRKTGENKQRPNHNSMIHLY